MSEERREEPGVKELEPLHQASFFPLAGRAGKEEGRQGRSNRQSHEQRREGRGHIRVSQRREELPLDPAEEKDGEKDQRDDEGGVDDGAADLQRSLENHAEGREGIGPPPVLSQPPQDVFHVDDGVVDHLADGDGQAPERHRVEGGTEPAQDQDGGEKRERNRGEADGGCFQVEKKEEQNHRHQDAADPQGPLQIPDGALDEGRLAEEGRMDRHSLGKAAGHFRQRALEGVGKLHRVSPRQLVHLEENPRLGVDGGVTHFELGAEPDPRHLAEDHGDPAAESHHGAFQVGEGGCQPLRPDRKDLLAGAEVSCCGQRRGGGSGRDDLADSDVVGPQVPRGHQDLVLLDATPEGRDPGDSGDREDPGSQGPVGDASKLQRIEPGPSGETHEQDRARGRDHRSHPGHPDARGEARRGHQKPLIHRLSGPIEIGRIGKDRGQDGDPGGGRGAERDQARGPVESLFQRDRDQRLNLRGGKTRRLGLDRDLGRGEFGEDVDGGRESGEEAEEDQEPGEDEDDEAIRERESDEPGEQINDLPSLRRRPSSPRLPRRRRGYPYGRAHRRGAARPGSRLRHHRRSPPGFQRAPPAGLRPSPGS